MFPKIPSIFLTVALGFSSLRAEEVKQLPCSLDPLLTVPENWQMTQDEFEENFKKDGNPLYMWLTKDRTRARIGGQFYADAHIDVTAFDGEVPVEEAIVDFADGKLNLVTLSIFNRGDAGDISAEDFKNQFTIAGKGVGLHLGAKPQRKNASSNSGLLTAGFTWYSQEKGSGVLEHNEKALEGGDREFLRLRFARPGATGSLAESMLHSRGGAAAKLQDLPKNVTKADNGDIFIQNIPMVDQGDKGYCVAASTQRAFEYYGIGADMHQIAQIAETDSKLGTNPLLMAKQLGKIDYRFKTRLDTIGMRAENSLTEVKERRGEFYVGNPVDERKYLKEIRSYIDSGLPLLWALELGRYPEKPQLTPQTAGGHMRMIIGYNDTTEEIIFSDSWGAGHEFKKMKMTDSYKATLGLFVLKPTVH